MGSLSRMSEVCSICPQKDKCSKKRMEACAYLVPASEPIAAEIEINNEIKQNIYDQIYSFSVPRVYTGKF